MHARPALRPNWYLLITVASWGLNFVALKEAYKGMSPPALALIRYAVMWAGLVIVCICRKESLRYPKEDLWRLLYLGFVSMGVYMLVFLEGMRGSSATEGSILLQMAPVFTAILAVLFRQEKFNVSLLSGALTAFVGTIFIVQSPKVGHENSLLGNALIVLAALLWAYSIILMRPLLLKYSPLRVLTLSMPGALPVMLFYGFSASLGQKWGAVTGWEWLMFGHVAIVSGIVAFLCFYQGVRQAGATGAALYQFLVPIAAMLFTLAIQGTVPTIYQLSGLVVVLAGVGYASRARYLAQVGERVNGRIGE